MNPPTGTVTLVFTDIQGSSDAWELHRAEFLQVLETHNQLMRDVAVRWNGYEVKTEGDAFFLSFGKATDAIRFCIDAQIAIQTYPWSTQHRDVAELHVRMGVHTGEPILGTHPDGTPDYFGHIVNRAARVSAAACGGQIVISDVMCALVHSAGLPEVTFLDLGNHNLKGIGTERLWQVCHPQLRREFPSLKTSSLIPNNLPRQLTSFIGRENEITEVKRHLSASSLVTLTGAGGCGKTRLALRVAADVLNQYRDGVWLAELAPLADPGLVPQSLSEVLGIREQPGQQMQQTLIDALKGKCLLIVLDNCEHVLPDCVQMALALLRFCPTVKVLATSREAFRVGGEQSYRVPSLLLPVLHRPITLDTASQNEAVRLFDERARSADARFALTVQNAHSISELCCKLDGIPLAIELAAARIRSMTVEEVARRLDDRFRLLTGGDRSALPRQQTLRALIDWSYDLLQLNEQLLFRRLSVFAGGWTLEAAETVCSGDGIEDWEVTDILRSLIDKSMVIYDNSGGDGRYRLLETLKHYSHDKLVEGNEEQSAQEQHLDFFLNYATQASKELKGPSQEYWLRNLEAEHGNLRHALKQCLQDERITNLGMSLVGALIPFWWIHGHLREGQEWCDAILSQDIKNSPTKERANVIHGAGSLTYLQGDYAAAQLLLAEGLAIRRKLREHEGIVSSLHYLGILADYRSEYTIAQSAFDEAMSKAREHGYKAELAAVLESQGNSCLRQGIYSAAIALFEESLALRRELHHKQGIASALYRLGVLYFALGDHIRAKVFLVHADTIDRELGTAGRMACGVLGRIALENGDYVEAEAIFEEHLVRLRSLGSGHNIAVALENMGILAYRRSRYPEAQRLFTEAILLRQNQGYTVRVADSLKCFAMLAAALGSRTRSACLVGAHATLREAIGSPLPPCEQQEYDNMIAELRTQLGEQSFNSAWGEGRGMSREEAVDYVLEHFSQPIEPFESTPSDPLVADTKKQIETGENDRVEFKRTLEFVDDADLRAKNIPLDKKPEIAKNVVHSSLKTICAMLNSEGGTLLIGVHDDGYAVGIEADLQMVKGKNKDGLELKLRDLLAKRISPAPKLCITIRFPIIKGLMICRLDLKPDGDDYHLDDDFYLRDGNRTVCLKGAELTQWIRKRNNS